MFKKILICISLIILLIFNSDKLIAQEEVQRAFKPVYCFETQKIRNFLFNGVYKERQLFVGTDQKKTFIEIWINTIKKTFTILETSTKNQISCMISSGKKLKISKDPDKIFDTKLKKWIKFKLQKARIKI